MRNAENICLCACVTHNIAKFPTAEFHTNFQLNPKPKIYMLTINLNKPITNT